jgi:hypothetical protein
MRGIKPKICRRHFLKGLAATTGAAAVIRWPGLYAAEPAQGNLSVGQGVVDTTPPLGIEMGGFHRPPGSERRITGIRQATAVRALVLKTADVDAAVISLDLAAFSADYANRVRQQVSAKTGIPAANVRLCATHTHSMPSFCYLRQWGAMPQDYANTVVDKAVQAVAMAKDDLAPASLSLGKSRAVGGNFNRTTKDFKTDAQFDAQSSEGQRWLDTMVRVLYFDRSAGKVPLLWYHFSAHPVCYADELAGPDWPGIVDQRLKEKYSLVPSYLQGHIGDVNPGDGDPWRGDAGKTSEAVYQAVVRATEDRKPVAVARVRCATRPFDVPLNVELFRSWLDEYRKDPSKCTTSEWVDAGFAKDWYEGNAQRNVSGGAMNISLSTLQLGDLVLAFHPAELYSYYGLAIQRSSPVKETVVVGYTDGIIGYLPDPKAYEAREYAAFVVPKILDNPPFTPAAAQQLTDGVGELIKQTVA